MQLYISYTPLPDNTKPSDSNSAKSSQQPDTAEMERDDMEQESPDTQYKDPTEPEQVDHENEVDKLYLMLQITTDLFCNLPTDLNIQAKFSVFHIWAWFTFSSKLLA